MVEENVEIQRKKEFLYRGKTLEELKKMEIREFAKLLPSRERRTVLRNSDSMEKFLTKCRKRNDKKKGCSYLFDIDAFFDTNFTCFNWIGFCI